VAVAASRTRRDVELRIVRDRDFDAPQNALIARMAAVLAAQEAIRQRQVGAIPALRQALVDLAAAAELVAGELPAPDCTQQPV
jgi:hypothetical protein